MHPVCRGQIFVTSAVKCKPHAKPRPPQAALYQKPPSPRIGDGQREAPGHQAQKARGASDRLRASDSTLFPPALRLGAQSSYDGWMISASGTGMNIRSYVFGRLSASVLFTAAVIAPMLAGCSSFSSSPSASTAASSTAASSTTASSRPAFDPFNFSFDRPQSSPESRVAMQPPAQATPSPPAPPPVSASESVATGPAGGPPPLDLEATASAAAVTDSSSLMQALRGADEMCSLPSEPCDGTHRVQN